MHTKAFPYLILLSLFWGTNIVASRFGIGEFDPYFFIALRLAIATLFFSTFLLFKQRALPRGRELWQKSVLSGVLGVAIPMSTFILSLQFQSSGVTSIYVTMAPVLIAIAAHFFLPDERVTRNKALGIGLAMAGSLFLALRGESGLSSVGRANPLGFVLVMAGLISEAINTVYVRLHMKALDPIQVTAIRLLTAALITMGTTLAFGNISLVGITAAGYFSLAYAALIGALGGQFLAFYVQRQFGATAFSLTAYMIPIVATIFGAVLLGELVTWPMGVGVILIGGGLFLINRRAGELRPKPASTD